MSKLKVMTVVGTRPEIIRLSRVIPALDQITDHVLVHTGQNYDYQLNEVFFSDLSLRAPDVFLGADVSSLGAMLGSTLSGIEKALKLHRPEAVLILGDTNSSIAAIMAKRLKIPVYHMEAGNRSFDPNVPEEVNRKIADHLSDFNLVYTEHARRHLIAEGISQRRIYLTGSPMNEVLDFFRSEIEASPVLAELKLEAGQYFLVSLHREENVDSKNDLITLLNILTRLNQAHVKPVIVSTHPRTRKRLLALDIDYDRDGITFAEPFGFHAYNNLQKNAYCVLSDSGTITEESSLLGFPAVTIRRSLERPEGLDTGSIVLTGLDSDIVLAAVDNVVEDHLKNRIPPIPVDYQSTNVSQRVARLILGTARLSNEWAGVRMHDYL